jgi:hypothetical protein
MAHNITDNEPVRSSHPEPKNQGHRTVSIVLATEGNDD